MAGWPILWPQDSDLDENGVPVLRPAAVATVCTDCLDEIAWGAPCGVIDREILCPLCADSYAPAGPQATAQRHPAEGGTR